MEEKQTILISSKIPYSIFYGIFFGFILVFIINHFGTFTYLRGYSEGTQSSGSLLYEYIPFDTPVQDIYLKTPFGSKFTFDGSNYTVEDVNFDNGKFNYSEKSKYYFLATFKESKYLFYFSLVFSILIYLFSNVKFKFS